MIETGPQVTGGDPGGDPGDDPGDLPGGHPAGPDGDGRDGGRTGNRTGRKRTTWVEGLRIGIVAFAIWLLLFAPTLQRNARASPVGTRRAVSLDLLGPVADVSRVLELSHIVSAADRAIGKGSGNGVRSALSSLGPSGVAGGTAGEDAREDGAGPGDRSGATTTAVPAYKNPTAAVPLRVLIVGDSLGIDLGQSLQTVLAGTGVVTATSDGQVDTGLTRPDYFNWPAELQSDLTAYAPEVVVVMLGANDPQDFPGPPDVPYGTARWGRMYAARVLSFMEEATSGGAKVVWVGQPPMATPGRTAAMADIDGIYRSEAGKVPGVTYMASAPIVGTPTGGYTAYRTVGGRQVQVRTTDGTHLAPAGARILAQAVMAELRGGLHIRLPAG
jgi:hypothetical protein